jgi:hypothetical protein
MFDGLGVVALFADLGLLATKLSKVVKLGTTNVAAAN